MIPDIDIQSGTSVVIAFPESEGVWRLVDTGLSGEFMADDDMFVIPIRDDITAEELARILTGVIARET